MGAVGENMRKGEGRQREGEWEEGGRSGKQGSMIEVAKRPSCCASKVSLAVSLLAQRSKLRSFVLYHSEKGHATKLKKCFQYEYI